MLTQQLNMTSSHNMSPYLLGSVQATVTMNHHPPLKFPNFNWPKTVFSIKTQDWFQYHVKVCSAYFHIHQSIRRCVFLTASDSFCSTGPQSSLATLGSPMNTCGFACQSFTATKWEAYLWAVCWAQWLSHRCWPAWWGPQTVSGRLGAQPLMPRTE